MIDLDQADLEGMARTLYDDLYGHEAPHPWPGLRPTVREAWRGYVEDVLRAEALRQERAELEPAEPAAPADELEGQLPLLPDELTR